MKRFFLMLLIILPVSIPTSAQVPAATNNSNYWPVYRNNQAGFRISYPPSWIIVQPKGPNVKFSVNPPDGSGNCNVVVIPKPEISNINQLTLNKEMESLPQSQNDWAGYIGLPVSQVRLISSRIGRVFNIPALIGIVETSIENLEGKYLRKQVAVLTFKPGVMWTLNCGASSFSSEESKTRFDKLEPIFNKVLGSFEFI